MTMEANIGTALGKILARIEALEAREQELTTRIEALENKPRGKSWWRGK